MFIPDNIQERIVQASLEAAAHACATGLKDEAEVIAERVARAGIAAWRMTDDAKSASAPSVDTAG